MKKINICIIAILALVASGCSLDLNPEDKATSANWFQTPDQLEMNLNALLHHTYWPSDRNEWGETETTEFDMWTDDVNNRKSTCSPLEDKLTSDKYPMVDLWATLYKGINRCNKIIVEARKMKDTMEPSRYNVIYGTAMMYRCCFYGRLMQHYGDVVVMDENYDYSTAEGREAAYQMSRESVYGVVLPKIMNEFDEAIAILPVSYGGGEVERATKGAALGMKARYALYFASIRNFDKYGLGDMAEAKKYYEIARDAAKACMDLGVYALYPDFGELFLSSTHHTSEGLFVIPRSKELCNNSKYQYLYASATTAKLPRNSGAPTCCTFCPSWDLFCAFYDNQGKPIDESTVYDCHDPFKNRDPRLAETIVEFGTEFLGFTYDPYFKTEEVFCSRLGCMIENNDTRAKSEYASYTGLIFKKGIDETWLSPFEATNDKIILRYADVLLMYAEAKIELGECDDSVRDAMNAVRGRAYNGKPTFPKITETDQAKLRSILRAERRMEFPMEALRFYDVMRWRIAEIVYNQPRVGLPASTANQNAYLNSGFWFFGATPDIDENGCPIWTNPVANGTANFFKRSELQIKARIFNPERGHLWPIPIATTQIMPNVKQNPGY